MRKGGGGRQLYEFAGGILGINCIWLQMCGDTNRFDIRVLPVRGRSGPPIHICTI